jgi:GAF domain-containing protein
LSKTIRVSNVHDFEGHIACDSASNSEIVIPIFHDRKCIAVLDIDSTEFNRFSEEDQIGLEKIVHILESIIKWDLG